VFDALRDTQPDASGEVQLTDALREVIARGGHVVAVPLWPGQRRHDIGSPEGYCATFMEYALRDERFGASLRAQMLDG
jgi:UTP--glucose-1-phosphate uridylyltransferase